MSEATVAVVTATVGTTDALREPSVVVPGVRYYCGSDRPIGSSVWERVELPANGDSAMTARRFKACWQPPRADAWLWIDAHYRLDIDPHVLLPGLLRHDLGVFQHPWCRSIEDEAREISGRGLVAKDVLREQIAEYRATGFRDTGHSSTGFLLRRADEKTAAFGRAWWHETQRHGHSRDQMSFDFVAWREGLTIGYLQGEYRDNPYAKWALEEAA